MWTSDREEMFTLYHTKTFDISMSIRRTKNCSCLHFEFKMEKSSKYFLPLIIKNVSNVTGGICKSFFFETCIQIIEQLTAITIPNLFFFFFFFFFNHTQTFFPKTNYPNYIAHTHDAHDDVFLVDWNSLLQLNFTYNHFPVLQNFILIGH